MGGPSKDRGYVERPESVTYVVTSHGLNPLPGQQASSLQAEGAPSVVNMCDVSVWEASLARGR